MKKRIVRQIVTVSVKIKKYFLSMMFDSIYAVLHPDVFWVYRFLKFSVWVF